MPAPSFDLIDVLKTIQKQKRIIIAITLVSVALGSVFFAIKKKKYKSAARFMVNNPLYGDRNTLFRNTEQRYVDYFGGDDDIDRVTALLGSDTVKEKIIRMCQFQVVYNADINTEKGHAFLMSVFDKNFNLKRTENKDMEASYVAYDSVTAANVANTAVKVAEEAFRSYYVSMKNSMSASINKKVIQLDSAISIYTDSLAAVRDRYGIYSILNPARQVIMSGEVHGKNTGRGMEEVQNVESIKDQLVADRAKYISLINEIGASTNEKMTYLQPISRAIPPTGPTGASLVMIIGVSAFLGFFFSTMLVLILAYYRVLMSVER